MGDDLKFIDFHQLQIENKKHVKEIDENNLIELSSPAGTDSRHFGKSALKHLVGVATYNYSQKKSLLKGSNFS